MTDTLYCSFCAMSQHEVRRLVAGPHVFACDGCVMLMAAMLEKEDSERFERPVADGQACNRRGLIDSHAR